MSTPSDHLHILYGDGELPGCIVVSTFGDEAACRWCRSVVDAVAQCVNLSPLHDAYFGLALQPHESANPRRRGSADTAVAIPGFAADIDCGKAHSHGGKNYPPSIDAAVELLNGLEHQPSLVTETGGGLHSYWLFSDLWVFSDDIEREDAKLLSMGWGHHLQQVAAESGWSLDSTFDLARVLRPAGTINHKYSLPVTILEHHQARRYQPADFAAWRAEPEAPKPKRSKSSGGSPEPLAGDVDPDVVDEVIILVCQNTERRRWGAIWGGDISGYASHSEADLGLCCRIAWFTRDNAALVDATFRQSGLMREKWDDPRNESTYGRETIERAIEFTERNRSNEQNEH